MVGGMRLARMLRSILGWIVAAVAFVPWTLSTAHCQDAPIANPLSEPPFKAALAGIDAEWNLSFRTENKVRVLPLSDLACWGRFTEMESGPQIVLIDGSIIRADLLKLDEQSLHIGDASGLSRVLWDQASLRRSAVHGLLLQPPAGPPQRDALLAALLAHKGIGDQLLLLNDESIAGRLVAAPLSGQLTPVENTLQNEQFQIVPDRASEPVAISASKVIGLVFGKTSSRKPPAKTAAWLGFRDGSLVLAERVEIAGDEVRVHLAAGPILESPLAARDGSDATFFRELTRIEALGPRIAWLADQKPLGYKHIPFLSQTWNYGAGANARGERLRAGGALFRTGLGMYPASRLAYDVAGFRRFQADVAIDDAAAQRGSVIFKVVLQDAQGTWSTAFESQIVRGGDEPLPVNVDLKGAQRMALIVEFADRGDELDFADWLDARLIK